MSLLPLLLLAVLAGNDNNIEWNGVSHVEFQDRRPLCPLNGESFDVLFQTFIDDISAARVQLNDGATQWINATLVDQRGPYDIWSATLPATVASSLSYFIELTDGTDVDYYSISGMSDATPVDGGFALDYTTLAHAPVGATLTSDGGAVFKVWAPSSTAAHVRGAFNGWGTGNPMSKIGEYFVAHVSGANPRDEYKYFFDNSLWKSDPRGRGLNPGSNLNTYVEDPFGYAWIDPDFATPAIEDIVIYQLHVGTFSGRNDPFGFAPWPARYIDVTNRAAHLAELGVNAVMLNPITEFAGDNSAGYNPISQWAPEWKYGTPDQLKQMIDTLHGHGIAVLIDIVWNHFSASDNFMWYYDGSQIYFDDPAVETPWGSQPDFDDTEVRDYLADSALHWLEEYRVDGFRMDATSYMNIAPQDASGWSLMQRFNDSIDNRYTDKIAIAEQLPDNDWFTRPTNAGGAGFDAQYYDHFTDRLREEIFDAATGDPSMFVIKDIIEGSGTYLSGRFVVNYLELHDEAWVESGGQRIVRTIDTTAPHDDIYAQGRVKLGQGLVMTAPGIPAILQGSEWLEDTNWGSNSLDKIDWSHKLAYPGIFSYFQDLIALRTSEPALRAGALRHVFHVNESGNVIGFRRYNGQGNQVVVIANFSNNDYTDYRVGLPEGGTWDELVNSQSSVYGGNGLDNGVNFYADAQAWDGLTHSAALDVAQMSLIVLQKVPDGTGIGDPAPELAPDGGTSLRLERVFPNPTVAQASIAYSLGRGAQVRVRVYDVSGRLVCELLNEPQGPGSYTTQWNGRDQTGQSVASGVYVARVDAGELSATVRLVVVK